MGTGYSEFDRRPPRVGELIRVCPGFGQTADYAMVYSAEEDDWYQVTATVRREVGDLTAVRIHLCENVVGERFLWCIELAKALPSDESPMGAELVMATTAEAVWCSRLATETGLAFSTIPQGVYTEPTWGSYSVRDAIEKGFRYRVIASVSHSLLATRRVAR